MSHLDNQKRQFTSRFYSNDITSFSNNDPRPAPSDSQLAAMTQNLDGAKRGVEGPWSRLSRIPQKGARVLMPGPRPGSVYQFVCPQSSACLVKEYCYLSWLTIFPRHYVSPVNYGWWRDVLGGILSHNMSQHLTTEMYAHKGTEVHIPKICPSLHIGQPVRWHL